MERILLKPGETFDLWLATGNPLNQTQFERASKAGNTDLTRVQDFVYKTYNILNAGESPREQDNFNNQQLRYRLNVVSPVAVSAADGITKVLYLLFVAGISYAIIKFSAPGQGTFTTDENGNVVQDKSDNSLMRGLGSEIGKGVGATLGESAPGITKAALPLLILLIIGLVIKDQLEK
jgi:hypothetical protein